MRAAIVKDGVVTNVIVVESIESFEDMVDGDLIATDTAGPGWTYAAGVFTPPV